MIKTSEKLNKLCNELYAYDFGYMDDLLTSDADFYTIEGKEDEQEAFTNGVKLAKLAIKKQLPIFEVWCSSGDFFIYFVKSSQDIKKIFDEHIERAQLDE